MKYFIDTEFSEGFRKPISWLPTIGSFNKPFHSIELISIGIVCEDGREYYAVSKDFDLKAAWNKFDIKQDYGKPQGLGDSKIYWLRDNVLYPIFKQLRKESLHDDHYVKDHYYTVGNGASCGHFKLLLGWYGKTNKQIAQDIIRFVKPAGEDTGLSYTEWLSKYGGEADFYAYFADYDWVVFSSLFGRMIDLPKGFPMYCRDLKQTLDEKAETFDSLQLSKMKFPGSPFNGYYHLDEAGTLDKVEALKSHPNYPKQENEHNALDDAKWNKELYNFLKS